MFCFFDPIYFLTVFDVGKIEVHVSKNEQPIKMLHYKMQGVGLMVKSVCDITFFSFLTFDLSDCLAQIWSHAPKFGAKIHYFNISKGR